MLGIPFTLLACTSGGLGNDTEDCGDDCLADLVLEVSETVPMGVRARWTVGKSGQCHVEYREEAGEWESTPIMACDPGVKHTAILRGLHADTEVEAQAVLTIAGEEHPRHSATARTDPIPEGAPFFDLEVPWTGTNDKVYIQGSFSGDQAGVFILDRQGRYVYLWMIEPDQSRDLFNARLSPDQEAFWILLNEERVSEDWGLLVRRNWFGEAKRTVEVPYGHHDLLPLEDGSVLVLEGIPDDLDQEEPIWGDRVVRVDPDDTQTEIWSSWDDLVPPESSPENQNSWFGPGMDWVHANSLAWNPERETILMGSAQLNTLFEIDGQGGGLLRSFGGSHPDSWSVDGDPFSHAHGSHWTDQDTLLLLSTGLDTKQTEAVEYALDPATEQLIPTWTYADKYKFAKVGGNASRRGTEGSTLVNFGSGLTLQEVDERGEVTWQISVLGAALVFQAWPLDGLWQDSER